MMLIYLEQLWTDNPDLKLNARFCNMAAYVSGIVGFKLLIKVNVDPI